MRENSYSLPTPGKTVAAPTPGEECPGKAAQHSPYGGNEPTESMGRSHVMENPHKRKLAEPHQITTAQTGAELPLKRPNSRRRPRKRNIQELENLVEAEDCKPMPLTSRKQHKTRKKARKGISFTQNYDNSTIIDNEPQLEWGQMWNEDLKYNPCPIDAFRGQLFGFEYEDLEVVVQRTKTHRSWFLRRMRPTVPRHLLTRQNFQPDVALLDRDEDHGWEGAFTWPVG